MGNTLCPPEDAALLASVARDICPFPNYNLNPVYKEMLFLNSSDHLSRHYAAVQSSLSPKQSEDFTQGLRTTFGREGKVTLGGVGVVALSLAVLFDTLAKQVKGEWVPDSGPIPNLYLKNPRGRYPSTSNTVSEYLRLIPHIANNPERMKEETKRYYQEMNNNEERNRENDMTLMNNDISLVNFLVSKLVRTHMEFHLHRIANSSEVEEAMSLKQDGQENPANTESTSTTTASASHVAKTRKRRNSFLDVKSLSFNCNPEEVNSVLLEEVEKSNHTKAAWNECKPTEIFIHHIADLVWMDVVFSPATRLDKIEELVINQREDFDLKAGALGKW